MEPVQVVREIARRVRAGESVVDLVSPEFRVVNDLPMRGIPLQAAGDPDARVEWLHDKGFTYEVLDVVAGTGGRVLVESVWSHSGGAGTSGLYWSVTTVRDGRSVEVQYFDTRAAAEEYAGVAASD